MKTRALVFVAVIGIAVAGCSTMRSMVGAEPAVRASGGDGTMVRSKSGAMHCENKSSTCKVSISVETCAGDKSKITANPDPVIVPQGRVWTIEWTIATPGYDFNNDGITFKHHIREGIFTTLTKAKAPGNKFAIQDDNTTPSKGGRFQYNVKVLKGKTECSYDPTVDNDG